MSKRKTIIAGWTAALRRAAVAACLMVIGSSGALAGAPPTAPQASPSKVGAKAPAGLSACGQMRHTKVSTRKGKLVPSFLAAAKLLNPKDKSIVASCGDNPGCNPKKPVNVLSDGEVLDQALVVKRLGGKGYWVFTDVWDTYQVAVTNTSKVMGDLLHASVIVPLYERVPFCEDENDPETCTSATADVGSQRTDHVIDPRTGKVLFTAFCELGEGETGDAKLSRKGDRFTYTSCNDDSTVTFTVAHLATCPTPAQNKAAALKRLINLGRGAVRAKRYNDAIAHFDDAVALDGQSASALAERGYANYKAGRLKRAKADLEAAITVAPSDKKKFLGAVHYNLGLVALAAKDKAGAKKAFTKSLEYRPNKTVKRKLKALQ